MYVVKNALKCIGRSKGRNVLIGIIALVIAISACIGLSIKQAAESARKETLDGMSVTATISLDRQSMMNDLGGKMPNGKGGSEGFDRDRFAEMMGETSSLSLEEYLKYAEAESVHDFYYTLTAYFNGSESLEPVNVETDEEIDENSGVIEEDPSNADDFPDDMNGKMFGKMNSNGEFTVIGYSGDNAMIDFLNGASSIIEGSVFDEGTAERVCIISEELAIYNSLSVGDTVTVTNTNLESETYELTVVGIYTSTASNDFNMSVFGTNQDPANNIYMSAAALQEIVDASEEISTTVTDENTGREIESAVSASLSATYVFADTEAYYSFEQEVRELGLDDSYTVSSSDITAFENSLAPLETLSKTAGWFLVVILAIGSVILVVLNIFNVRERKYEIGVLTAMGMKKRKVAAQFMCEILVVTMLAVLIGAAVGAVSSVPVTNALLEDQIESQNEQQAQRDNNFGRPGNMGNMGGQDPLGGNTPGADDISNSDGNPENGPFGDMFGEASNYITEIDSAMNLTVVLQMIGIGLLLTLIASAASVLFVMRYDPLKILANRD